MGGPIPEDELADWADDDVASWELKPTAVYDRHPLFSELVYGPIVRGKMSRGFTRDFISWNHSRMKGNMLLLIVCLPPFETVKANLESELKELQNVNHSAFEQNLKPHGYDHMSNIWSAYTAQSAVWGQVFTMLPYDYTTAMAHCEDPHCTQDHDPAVTAVQYYYHTREQSRIQALRERHRVIG